MSSELNQPRTIKRVSLVEQTTDLLKESILRGRWTKWLPGERELSRQLGISRTSYRLALQSLAAARWIEQVQGRGSRVLRAPHRVSPEGNQEIGLILPGPLGQLRPSTTLWIDELRARLAAEDLTLKTFHGDRFYARQPGPTLRALTRDHAASCWILVMSTRPTQEWFAKNRMPCIVAGTVHGATPLASVDVDCRAVCRHAAGVLLAAGHRRIALLNRRLPGPDSDRRGAGDREGEFGFREAVQASKLSGADATVIYHDHSREGVAQALRHLLNNNMPVTGIVVSDSHCYLAATGFLAQRRLRIPQDISVISRDHDTFLEYLVPRPTRYVINPETYAHRVLTQVKQALRRGLAPAPAALIIPSYVPGQSVGARPLRPTSEIR